MDAEQIAAQTAKVKAFFDSIAKNGDVFQAAAKDLVPGENDDEEDEAESSPFEELGRTMPVLRRRVVCPEPTCYTSRSVSPPGMVNGHQNILSTVIFLNDMHGWTRERIADWLESLDIDMSFPVASEVE